MASTSPRNPWNSKLKHPVRLYVTTDGSWRDDLKKATWGAYVMSERPQEERIFSNKFRSCVNNGQAEILAVERILAELANLPKGSSIFLSTDYKRTADQTKVNFPAASQDTPEGQALNALQRRILQLEKAKIRMFIEYRGKHNQYPEGALDKAHNAARREMQLEEQRRTPPRKKRLLPRIPPGTGPER